MLRYCGGSEGQLLSETGRSVRARVSRRSLGSPFWEALCHEHRAKENLLFYRHAVLKLALTNTAVLASDAKKASAGLAPVRAHKVLQRCRASWRHVLGSFLCKLARRSRFRRTLCCPPTLPLPRQHG